MGCAGRDRGGGLLSGQVTKKLLRIKTKLGPVRHYCGSENNFYYPSFNLHVVDKLSGTVVHTISLKYLPTHVNSRRLSRDPHATTRKKVPSWLFFKKHCHQTLASRRKYSAETFSRTVSSAPPASILIVAAARRASLDNCD